MKYWYNAYGALVGYESDFPAGTPGLTLKEKPPQTEGAGFVAPIETEEVEEAEEVDERETLVALHIEKFGKPPHHMMKIANIKKALEQ